MSVNAYMSAKVNAIASGGKLSGIFHLYMHACKQFCCKIVGDNYCVVVRIDNWYIILQNVY